MSQAAGSLNLVIKSDKEYSNSKARELDRKEKELKSILSEIDQITLKLQPIRQSIKEVQVQLSDFLTTPC